MEREHKFHRISPRNGKIIIWNGEKPGYLYPTLEEVEIPNQILEIASEWRTRSNAEGDKGCCVLGAGMYFTYENVQYKMEPQSQWQGELSWTAHKDWVIEELKRMGAENVYYEWGMMD